MEIVRIKEPHEYPPKIQRVFERVKDWFGVDFVPKMDRAQNHYLEFGDGFRRAAKVTMPDGELSRGQKEMIAGAVSAINVCEY